MRVEEIERYLTKQMPPEEREHFKKEMESNPSLRFDVQLVAAVIRKTREVYLRRDQELATRMCESRKSDKKRFRVTIATMFVATVAAVASLLFVGYKVVKKNDEGNSGSTTVFQDKNAPYDIQTGIADAAGGKGDKLFPIEVKTPTMDTLLLSEKKGGYKGGEELGSAGEAFISHTESSVPKEESTPQPEESGEKEKEESAAPVLPSSPPPSSASIAANNYPPQEFLIEGIRCVVNDAYWSNNSLVIDLTLGSTAKNIKVNGGKFKSKTHFVSVSGNDFLRNLQPGHKTLSSYEQVKGSTLTLEKEEEIRLRLHFESVVREDLMADRGSQTGYLLMLSMPAIHKNLNLKRIRVRMLG